MNSQDSINYLNFNMGQLISDLVKRRSGDDKLVTKTLMTDLFPSLTFGCSNSLTIRDSYIIFFAIISTSYDTLKVAFWLHIYINVLNFGICFTWNHEELIK